MDDRDWEINDLIHAKAKAHVDATIRSNPKFANFFKNNKPSDQRRTMREELTPQAFQMRNRLVDKVVNEIRMKFATQFHLSRPPPN